MNNMREYSTVSHSDEWAKHLKKLSRSRDKVQVQAPPATPQNLSCHGLSRKPKWGK